MIRIENDCCSCAVPGYPCLGKDCSLRHNPHYYCDLCGKEIIDVYHEDDMDLCEKCYREEYEDGSKTY